MEDIRMKQQFILDVTQSLLPILDNFQLKQLEKVLERALQKYTLSEEKEVEMEEIENEVILEKFVDAKRVEGCSEKTIKYYHSTLLKALNTINLNYSRITTDDLRHYLTEYQKMNDCSKANIDNIRRILSSFFSWLEDENFIIKSPVRRIHKIKTAKTVKETYTDEALEELRDHCENVRDLAIIDLLASTGMRVGELVNLNIIDIDFENRECIVFGKGAKERPVYFDARTKIHLKNYLESRTDQNPALFVTLNNPHKRLQISGVEIRLRELGRKLGIHKVHPHKFRRTLATKAIDKGMPIEQVQQLLGHSKIDTTMEYAMVNQNNVKLSHQKYLA